jgi:DNA-binding CsgD family transcriptional regulator
LGCRVPGYPIALDSCNLIDAGRTVTRVSREERARLDNALYTDPKPLLTDIFSSSPVGFAILDDQLRFEAINKALAEMNGVPLEDHLGKTIREVLGPVAAAYLEPKLARAFATAEAVCFNLVTVLPTRTEKGYWTVSYFPIGKLKGCVHQVCATVTELTVSRQLQLYLYGFSRKLLSLKASLNSRTNRAGSNGYGKLLDACISEMVAISKLPGSPLDEITPEVLDQYEQLSLGFVAGQSQKIGQSPACVLPPRARQVVQHLAQGECSKEIAYALGISVRTVEMHRARIMERLGVRSVAQLILYAVRNQIV